MHKFDTIPLEAPSLLLIFILYFIQNLFHTISEASEGMKPP